jgi:hypothetical protein
MAKINFTLKPFLIVPAVIGVLAAGLLMLQPGAPATPQELAREFTAAQTHWAQRPFSHYRLVSELTFAEGQPPQPQRCQQDLEVLSEKVITTFQDTCPPGPRLTVTDMFYIFFLYVPSQPMFFGLLATPLPGRPVPTPHVSRTPADQWIIAPDKCHQYYVTADFDAQLGYPHHIETQLESRADSNACFVENINGMPQYQGVTIVSLTPLP